MARGRGEKTAVRRRNSPARGGIATNKATPIDTLVALVADRDTLVRAWVATNPRLPRERLDALARDDDKVVRNHADSAMWQRGSKL